MNSGNPLSARNLPSITVPMTTMKILAVPLSVREIDFLMTSQLRDFLTKARIKARKAPTAPASVGVKTPMKIPMSTPSIKTGSGQTSESTCSFSSLVKVSLTGGARLGFSLTRMKIHTQQTLPYDKYARQETRH